MRIRVHWLEVVCRVSKLRRAVSGRRGRAEEALCAVDEAPAEVGERGRVAKVRNEVGEEENDLRQNEENLNPEEEEKRVDLLEMLLPIGVLEDDGEDGEGQL